MPTNKKPTAAQFYKKFGPDIEINTNCLKDIACPKCGSRSHFSISAMSTFEMHDDGTEEHADVEYGESNHTSCGSCDHIGSMFDFTIDGLDELLEAKEQKTETL